MDRPFVNIHTHRRTGSGVEVVSVMAGHGEFSAGVLPAPPFSVGVHPWQLGDPGDIDLELALREVETAPASAIGEIGLDHAVPGDPGLQKMIFAAQLRIAGERRLPVVLHCVRAFEPVMEILSAYRLPAVIFHGFTGSREQATRAMKSVYYLSFGERSLASPKTLEALRMIPPERLFLETDESTLPIGEIYAHAAGILGMSVPELARHLYNNYLTVFGK